MFEESFMIKVRIIMQICSNESQTMVDNGENC
jgi:hypothetical protein